MMCASVEKVLTEPRATKVESAVVGGFSILKTRPYQPAV